MSTRNVGKNPETRIHLKTKILTCCATAALILPIAKGAWANAADSAANLVPSGLQVIQMNDGTRLTFLGLTHGKRHAAPHYEKLPTGNWLYTPDDKTVAWIEAEHDPNRWPSFELLVFDKANTGCVSTEKQTSSHVKNGVDVQGFILKAFPRWDKEMILRVRPYQSAVAEGQFVVATGGPGPFENWKPEPMPAAKADGDFEVTLTNLVAGVPVPYRRGDPGPDNNPANQCVRIAFGFQQKGRSMTNWNPRMAKTFDPFGNVAQGVISDYPKDGIFDRPPNISPNDGYFYRPGLWPEQSPWKVRLEFTRTSGFSDDETLTFTNLPVRAGSQQEADEQWTWDETKTNFTFTIATIKGVRVKLLEPLWYPAKVLDGEKHIRVMIYTDPTPRIQELRLTLIEATDEQGQALWAFPPAWAGHFDLDFPRPREIRSLNLKLALHKSRFVDFTVQPSKH